MGVVVLFGCARPDGIGAYADVVAGRPQDALVALGVFVFGSAFG